MTAKIRKTNDGRYYLSVVAETTAEQLELTAMHEQMRDSDYVMHEFGGAAAENSEVERQLDINLNLIVREPEEVQTRLPNRHRFLAELAGCGQLK